ncbi:MAG: 23S rRNA (uracil(1939)-C(5))-methyltransferase RlmD [Geoalkalibacter sp.]|uniref:23S rRNA (uracil(1939)-C(5))-methyltransferase RlmD n=1 Tax=Geoalkalibacter sp. TaxID=3041440 RepID=UPI003D0BBEB3
MSAPSEIYIDALAYGGAGVGRLEGKAVFVPGAVPGDRVVFRPKREKKRFIEGELVSVASPAPDRIEARCAVFGKCGGCHWQCLPYAEQLRWKRSLLQDFLVRQAGVDPDTEVTLRAAPNPWHYRSRIQIKCRRTPRGFVMGFYRANTHFVVNIAECPIAAKALNDLLPQLRACLADCRHSDQIPQINLAVDDEGARAIVVHFIGGDPQSVVDAVLPICKTQSIALFLQQGRKETLRHIHGDPALHIHPLREGELKLAYPVGGFAQVNLDQNRQLVAELLDCLGDVQGLRILDLFCGMGNLSLPLAAAGAQVTGVEDFGPAIDRARSNASAYGLKARFVHAPAERILASQPGTPWDVVVLDPPRQGAYDVARELVRRAPERVVYVSCDPSTLGRDLKPLLYNGYRLEHAVGLDLFPQTFHIESLALLKRI